MCQRDCDYADFKVEVEDKIKGIDIGANDYVKPFGLSELFEVVARVNRFSGHEMQLS